MINFYLRHQPLDLFDNASYAIEARSPLFEAQAIPGTRVYSFNVPATKANQRLFKFAERTGRHTGGANIEQQTFPDAEIYLFGTRWRTGTLKLREASSEGYSLSFHTDAGDLAARIAKKRLTDLDLGTDVLNFNADPDAIYPQRKYALFPVKNPAFYGDANSDFGGYVNDYSGGQFATNTAVNAQTIVPFPFLLYVLNRVAGQLGYLGVSGPWTQEEDVRRLVIYNTYALDELFGNINTFRTQITYTNHVPPVEVGKFLVAVKNLFGLAIFINPRTRYLEFVRLTDVLALSGFSDYSRLSTAKHTLTPNESDGFALGLGKDSGDEIYKSPNPVQTQFIASQTYRSGNGAESFEAPIGTLFALTEEKDGRQWTIPQSQQGGNSSAYEIENPFSLRLLFYKGLQTDSQGNAYPQASAEGNHYKLGYTGFNGLYERCWRPWLDFLSVTQQVETTFNFHAPEIMRLDFRHKIMRQHVKYFIKDYKLSITRQGIRPAQVTLQKVRT